MKLSISQYNEIFNDRSITNYTKFNWLGIQPSGFNVSNLVEGCVGANATILKHNSNDIQDYEWINTNSYGGIQKIYLVSSLQYGDYRYHFDINYSTNSIYFIVYNVTKGKRIIELISNDGTFTLTHENYSVGDDIQIKAYMADNGSTASIFNFFVCKIQDVIHPLSSFTFPIYSDAYLGFDITDFTPNTDEFRITITDLKFNRAYNYNSVWCFSANSDTNESWLDSNSGLNNRITNDALRCNIYNIDVNTASTYVFNKLSSGINVSYQNKVNSATGTASPVIGSLVIGAIPGNTNPEYTFTSVVIENLTTNTLYTLYPQLYQGKYYLYDTQHDKRYELKHQHSE